MEKMSPGQIGADIQKFFPHFNSDKQKNDKAKFKGAFQNRDGLMVYAGESALFHDLCQIGALLTDEAVCLKHLKTLNEQMVLEFAQLNSEDPRIGSPTFTQRAGNDHAYKGVARPEWLLGKPPKFGGILKKILMAEELKWGFNGSEAEPTELPTLSGFVHPDSFNDLLLRQARHWKDPGASIHHGEYTHRLQWWIICCEHASGGLYRLKQPPVKRFRQLPKYTTSYWRTAQIKANNATAETAGSYPSLADVYTNRSLWDFLCDCVPADDSMRESTPASDTFRSPQYMNLYLTAPAREFDHPEIRVLYNYLVARFNKRTWQNANNMLRPYKAVLAKKWGMNEEEFDLAFADVSKYGRTDVYATVDGQVVSKPK